MEISADIVKDLRVKTGAGIMDCKEALKVAGGNFEKAIDFLREKGLSAATKKSSRATKDGLVTSYIHMGGKVGVMIEVNCETDFVAKTEDFKTLTRDLAMHVAAMNPLYVNPAGRRMIGLPDMAAACRVKVQDYYFPEDQRFIAEEFFPRVLREGNGEVEIYEVRIPKEWNDRTLGELTGPLSECRVVALTRAGRSSLPEADTKLQTGDMLTVSSTFKGIGGLTACLSGKAEV